MKTATGISASVAGAHAWTSVRRSPMVVVLAGIDASEIVDAALTDTALTEAAMLRFEPDCTPPCDALLWRLETATGESLERAGLARPPVASAALRDDVRLVQYQPGSVVPEILDEGTLGTRGSYAAFTAAVDRLAMRFVRDAALGRGRGPVRDRACAAPPAACRAGWMPFCASGTTV